MKLKALAGTALVGFIFLAGTVEAYDLPKLRPDKKITAESSSAPKKLTAMKGSWAHAEAFEKKIKAALAENENLPASSPARVPDDKNLIFVAFYHDNAYFIDKYSVKVTGKNSERRSWKQHIFPIGAGISGKNSKATSQKFSVDSRGIYNSSGHGNKISAVEDEADRKFLEECFKVGYYCAFGVDFDKL